MALGLVSAWSLQSTDDDPEVVAAATPTTTPVTTEADTDTTEAASDTETNAEPTTTTTAAPGPSGTTVTPSGAPVADAAPPLAGGLTGDGRPAVFYAITTDGIAIEVDTTTGRVLREIGGLDNPSAAQGDEPIQTLDAIWPIPGGDGAVLISECCEPAAGRMYRVEPGATLEASSPTPLMAWAGEHDARGERVVLNGYTSRIRATDESGAEISTVDLFDSPGVASFVTWLTDRDGVMFAEPQPDANRTVLRRFDFGIDGSVAAVAEIPVPYVARDLTVRADGNLVLLATEPDGVDRGIILSPDGELQTAFDTSPGATVLDYGPRGLFVIELDRNGRATWQGLGESGELGDGYLWVQW